MYTSKRDIYKLTIPKYLSQYFNGQRPGLVIYPIFDKSCEKQTVPQRVLTCFHGSFIGKLRLQTILGLPSRWPGICLSYEKYIRVSTRCNLQQNSFVHNYAAPIFMRLDVLEARKNLQPPAEYRLLCLM